MASKPKKILVSIVGGMGLHIAATAALASLRKTQKDATIHVVQAYQDVLLGLDSYDRIYGDMGLPYFSEDHEEFEMIQGHPYAMRDFRQGHKHIVDAWCEILGVPIPNDKSGFLRVREGDLETANRFIEQIKKQFPGKPIVAFQPFGGTSFYDAGAALDMMRPRMARDLPLDLATDIANKITEAGAVVVQIGLPTERQPGKNCLRFDLGKDQQGNPVIGPPQFWFAALKLCDHFVGVDSFAQHAWAALNKPTGKKDEEQKKRSVVLWGATKPQSFSYPCHTDLEVPTPCKTPHCGRPYVGIPDLIGRNAQWECQREKKCMNFKGDDVVKALKLDEKPKDDKADNPADKPREADKK